MKKNVVFLKDFWSFRRGQVVPVAELTVGRAHLVIARGFAEWVPDEEKPKPKRKYRKQETEKAITTPEEHRVRSETTDTTDEPAD